MLLITAKHVVCPYSVYELGSFTLLAPLLSPLKITPSTTLSFVQNLYSVLFTRFMNLMIGLMIKSAILFSLIQQILSHPK